MLRLFFSAFPALTRSRWRLLTASALTGALATVTMPPAYAQQGSRETPRDITTRLVALASAQRARPEASRDEANAELRTLAAERAGQFVALMAADPAEALRLAVPSDIRAALPPDVQAEVEQAVSLEGTLEVLVEDHATNHRVLYFLRNADERLALHFADNPPGLVTGDRVRVRGARLRDTLALADSSTSVQPLAVALPNTFGEQRTAVILVNFQDAATQPYTPAAAANVVFNTTSNFDLEGSAQQTWLAGDVFGWFTIPMASTVCDTTTLATLARQAATATGANLSTYTRFVYGFPQNACTWWGLGTVGGNPSSAWINGPFELRVVGHEMGHNFGLYHARSLDCGTTPIGPACTASEYGDTSDIMGATTGHFNAYQKDRLGWLNHGASPAITTVNAGGTYSIDPLETLSGNPKALKILQSSATDTWYYVEFRRSVGFDSFMGPGLTEGLVIHTGSGTNGNTSNLLDMTSTSSFSDAALPVGQTFTDASIGLSITPVSVGSSALVSVVYGAAACAPANPTLTVSPSATQWVTPGTPVTYTLAVTNANSGSCDPETFNLGGTLPTGWSGGLGASSLTLAPGASATTTMQATSPPGTPDGFYNITGNVTSAVSESRSASQTVTQMVASNLTISAASAAASYTTKQTVTLTAAVSVNGSPVVGTTVSFVITKSNGARISGSAVTGSTGVATWRTQIKPRDPTGTYNATATASSNGLSGLATTSFVVR